MGYLLLRILYARCAELSQKMGPRPALHIVRDATRGFFGVLMGEGICFREPASLCILSFLAPSRWILVCWRAKGNIVRVFRWSG
jgi:hypothetical protein